MMVQREPGIESLAYREYLKTNQSKFEPGRGGGDPEGCPPFLYRFPCRKGNKDSLMMQKRWQATRIYVIIINMIL